MLSYCNNRPLGCNKRSLSVDVVVNEAVMDGCGWMDGWMDMTKVLLLTSEPLGDSISPVIKHCLKCLMVLTPVPPVGTLCAP